MPYSQKNNSLGSRCTFNGVPVAWNKDNKDEYKTFKNQVETMAKGIDNAPQGKEKMAVYRSDLVTDIDTNCPKTRFQSYGYICNTKLTTCAEQDRYRATYQSPAGGPDSMTFSHEQIGHVFAGLDDEYVFGGPDPKYFNSRPSYNCTSKDNVKFNLGKEKATKWGLFLDSLWTGCRFSNEFRRPSYNSIMNWEVSFTSFNSVGKEVMRVKYDKYPNGPENWKEYLKLK